MRHDDLLDGLIERCRPLAGEGRTAEYIPELGKMRPDALGICLAHSDGSVQCAGDALVPFTIQSIVKVFIFTQAIMDCGLDTILSRVSLEPTASEFNAIADMELRNGPRPLNPMINAGAIACLTFVAGDTAHDKFSRVLAFVRTLSGNPDLDVHEAVYRSEKETGTRNRALAYYMASNGILEGDVEAILDAYFRLCSIQMTCVDLAKCALVFAANGHHPEGREPLFPPDVAHTVKAVMATCGMYNESGSFAVEVGLPAKSGVGGGLMGVVPGKMGIGIFGPALNDKGSSVAGIEMLRLLSRELDLSIY